MERKLFAVTGNPAARSLFPIAFRTFLKYNNSKDIYTRLVADSVQEAFAAAKLSGLSGLNIAYPFRIDAADVTDKSFRVVENIGAVNTVILGSDGRTGYNTEFQSLQPFLCRIFGDKVGSALILGTSPDATAAACGFAAAGWKVIVLGNTLSSAVECAVKCGGDAGEFDTLDKHIRGADLVVCAGLDAKCKLDLSLIGRVPVLLLGCDDEFEALCSSMNIVSNISFVLAQAAIAYAIFTGTFPDDKTIEAARIELEKKREKKRIISFIGFASTGKTSCAKALADKLSYNFVDLDAEIEKASGKHITNLLEEEGLDRFCALEHQILDSVCKDSNVVLSCGCDTVFSPENQRLIKEKTCPIWLVSTSELILKKRSFMAYRPQSGESMIDAMERLFDGRKTTYADTSELIIRSDVRTPEETAIRLLSELKEKNL